MTPILRNVKILVTRSSHEMGRDRRAQLCRSQGTDRLNRSLGFAGVVRVLHVGLLIDEQPGAEVFAFVTWLGICAPSEENSRNDEEGQHKKDECSPSAHVMKVP